MSVLSITWAMAEAPVDLVKQCGGDVKGVRDRNFVGSLNLKYLLGNLERKK